MNSTLTISGKSLTLDLNGHKLSSSATITVSVGAYEGWTFVPGTLTVTDTGSGGTIENTNTDGYCVVVTSSAFTLENGTLSGKRGVVMNGISPSFQMQGGSIVATNDGVCTRGNFVFSGGTISGGGYSIFGNGTSTLQGGRIQSGAVGCGDGVQLKATLSECFSVTFKNSDGTCYAFAVVSLTPQVAAPTGTVFAGWYTAEGEKWDFTQKVTQDMTLTAKFEATVTTEAELKAALADGFTDIQLKSDITMTEDLVITQQDWNLDLNGHTLSGSQIKFSTGKMTVTDSVGGGSVNNSIALTNATLSGTVFQGFVNCVMSTIDGGAFYGQVNLITGSDVKNGLFYAQNAFGTATTTGKQVAFQLNGSFLYMQVTTGTVAEPEVAKTGYTFTGWCQDAGCKGDKWDFTKPVSGNMTLYATKTVKTYTITYDKGADDATGTIENGTKEYGKDFTLNMATYSRKGYVQVGWKGSDGKTYTGGAVYPDNADLTLTAIWEEVNSFTVPFTKTVKQSGSTKPGKATFSLYICGIEKLPSASGDIDCTGRVDIKGTGDFTGELTISGSRKLVWAMLENGIYIREWDSEMDNWTYDDSVYFLRLNQYDDGYQLDVYDATAKTVGQSMVFSHGNKTVKMTFTNTYGTTTTTADSSNPKTGDNISVAVATLILSTMALVAILPRKKRI